MPDVLPLSRKGSMISSTSEMSREIIVVASLCIFLEAFETLVANMLGEEFFGRQRGSRF